MLRIVRWHLRRLCVKIRFRGLPRPNRSSTKLATSNITFTAVQRRSKPALLPPSREKEKVPTTSYGAGRREERVLERFGEIDVIGAHSSLERFGEIVGIGARDSHKRSSRRIRIATFNVALFSLAPAVPKHHLLPLRSSSQIRPRPHLSVRTRTENRSPPAAHSLPSPSRSNHSFPSTARTKPRLPRTAHKNSRPKPPPPPPLSSPVQLKSLLELASSRNKGKLPLTHDSEASTSASNAYPKARLRRSRRKSPESPLRGWQASPSQGNQLGTNVYGNGSAPRTILDILREADADLVALQDVKADEAKGMKPLSELAEALGMQYAFAESWAPEFGNAVLSRWPIKRWEVKKIADESDYRNVLKVVVDVPSTGELHFYCTHLDHLDEDWRLRQVISLTGSCRGTPHILAGNLNALEPSDYSKNRWNDIAKLRASNGKMPPRDEVMSLLKKKGYRDSKSVAGESETVVVLPPGQDVQGTCKYATRVDYILASPRLPYRFVPGSYTIVSSKGTSDHHLVKVEIQPTASR